MTKRILLIIGGGIAAYKCLELIRRLRDDGVEIRVVMTRAAQEFITPLSVGALSGNRVFTELFDLDDEREIGHIRLSRAADLIVVAPATADLLARMAGGHANDLASSILLATNRPVLAAPAMNPHMWRHPATKRNVAQLVADGIQFIGPNVGEMAESGEAGPGRMAEPEELRAGINAILLKEPAEQKIIVRGSAVRLVAGRQEVRQSLAGRRVLVTTGPTYEPIDPVRYIANRSSGKQGDAIARAAAELGADVVMVSGPTNLPDPPGVKTIRVESALQMLEAVEDVLPVDIAIFAAAVADWRSETAAGEKIKKRKGRATPSLNLVENPDILRTIAGRRRKRPQLVIGFAAETEKVVEHARKKLQAKGCDWIVANDVSAGTGVMGGDRNSVIIVTESGDSHWPNMSKDEVARRLIQQAADSLAATGSPETEKQRARK